MRDETARVLARLLPPLRPEWRAMLGTYLISVSSQFTLLAIGLLAALGVGSAVVHGTPPPAQWWVTICALVLVRGLLTWCEMNVSHALAYRVLSRLRTALFDAYSRSVPARRIEHSGRAASVAMTDIEKLEFFYAHTLAQICASATLFGAAVCVAWVMMPVVAFVMIGGAVGVVLTAVAGGAKARQLGAAAQQERERHSERVVDALGALREVLAYGLRSRVISEVIDGTRRLTLSTLRREHIARVLEGSRELILTGVIAGVVGSVLVTVGDDEPLAVLPALVALAIAGVAAIADASHTLSELHPLVASARRVDEGLSRRPVVKPVIAPVAVPSAPLGLRFRDVRFAYDDKKTVLDEWSVTVRPGEHVGLTGPSGAGKSTILALASRLWDPLSGSVEMLDSTGRSYPLDRIDDRALRRLIGVVDQEARLFHGTIRENLLRGTQPRTDDYLNSVLDLLEARQWIDLDDHVGEHGLRLSGGQRARIALARALCRQPRILLVDEVTSSLDPESERAIGEALADFKGTVIVASHRRETLNRMQRVVRLDGHALHAS